MSVQIKVFLPEDIISIAGNGKTQNKEEATLAFEGNVRVVFLCEDTIDAFLRKVAMFAARRKRK